jgi:hypothetical protein
MGNVSSNTIIVNNNINKPILDKLTIVIATQLTKYIILSQLEAEYVYSTDNLIESLDNADYIPYTEIPTINNNVGELPEGKDKNSYTKFNPNNIVNKLNSPICKIFKEHSICNNLITNASLCAFMTNIILFAITEKLDPKQIEELVTANQRINNLNQKDTIENIITKVITDNSSKLNFIDCFIGKIKELNKNDNTTIDITVNNAINLIADCILNTIRKSDIFKTIATSVGVTIKDVNAVAAAFSSMADAASSSLGITPTILYIILGVVGVCILIMIILAFSR